MFKRKSLCVKCNSKVSDNFDFCPYCGLDLRDPEKDNRDFGVLGKNNMTGMPMVGGFGGLGISDKMINSLMKNLFKAFDSQMKELNPEVSSSPNKIRIKFGMPGEKVVKKRKVKRDITNEQIERMSGMPRIEGKTDVRRLSDKVVYEIKAPGLESAEDVFFSKVESGYEVKAIGKKKVYVNNLPVNLPLRGYSVKDNKLLIEFELEN